MNFQTEKILRKIWIFANFFHFRRQNRTKIKFCFILYRQENGTVQLKNPHLPKMEEDILYHLQLGTKSHDLEQMFGDVKVLV